MKHDFNGILRFTMFLVRVVMPKEACLEFKMQKVLGSGHLWGRGGYFCNFNRRQKHHRI